MRTKSLRTLQNLGPKSESLLIAAGIDSIEKLLELGAVRAWLAVKNTKPDVSLNLLWSLEGALTGVAWQLIARHQRSRLLIEVDALQSAPPLKD